MVSKEIIGGVDGLEPATPGVTGRYPRIPANGHEQETLKINNLSKPLVRSRSLEYAASQHAVYPLVYPS